MIQTRIPYQRGEQYAPADGPTECYRCARTLLDRSSDADEDTVDPRTSAEIVVHIWEHDDDGEGHALCGPCVAEADQLDLWTEILRWQRAAPGREAHIARDRLDLVTVDDGVRHMSSFEAVGGDLRGTSVMAFLAGPAVKRFEDTAAALGYARQSDAAEEECPKTERNLEHE